MKDLAANAFLAFFGLAGGIAVGSGMVAFLVVLDIIPRLAQITRSFDQVLRFESAVVIGSVFWTFADFFTWSVPLWPAVSSFVGLFDGIFVGMLAAALTEVLNVFPILAKRLKLNGMLVWLLMAMVLGKVCGSLFDWLVFQMR